MKILNLTQGSDEWLAARKQFLCASEAPAMMGDSVKKTRDELLAAKAGFGDLEYSRWVQENLLDKGHRSEAAARPKIEAMLNAEHGDLFDCVGVDGDFLASFDGITADGMVVWENKLLSKWLIAQIESEEIHPNYYWQLEHQLLVSGAEEVLFSASSEDGSEVRTMVYRSIPERRAALIFGWAQFAQDMKHYRPPIKTVEAVGVKPDSLPALFIEVTGSLTTASNLEEYRKGAEMLIGSIKTDLQTDQDFADADAAVKWLHDAEKKIDVQIESVMARAGDLNALVTTLRDVQQSLMRTKRLALNKQVDAQKANRRNQIIADALAAFAVWLDDVNAEFFGVSIHTVKPDFAGAIKSKRSFDAMQSACNDLLAQSKIQVNEIAARYRKNLAELAKHPDHAGLFPDIQALVQMDHGHLLLLIQQRISEHKAKEEARIQAEAERRAKEIAERERAERERLAAEQKAEADRIERERIASEQSVSVQASSAITPSSNPKRDQAPPARAIDTPPPQNSEPKPARIEAPVTRSFRPDDEEIIAIVAGHWGVDHETAREWVLSVGSN